MEEALISEKKCPHCGQWSAWQQQHDDRCRHCGQLLDPRAQRMHTFREQQRADNKKKLAALLVAVRADDPWHVRVGKRLFNGVQLVFAAIISFIIWLATAVAG